MWDKDAIKKHIEVTKILEKIKNNAFYLISKNPNITEWDVKEYILKQYRKHNIVSKPRTPIVAFGNSADNPHYFPTKEKTKQIKKNTLIMIDIWGALREKNAPYGDITWMGFYGRKVPNQTLKIVDTVFLARDKSLEFIKKELRTGKIPTGKEIDGVSMGVLIDAGFKSGIRHTTGHSIGFSNPHGRPTHISRRRGTKKLKINVAYTIEPGIYIDGKLGVRSEIDFYIDENLKLQITTPVQKKLIFL